jgi:mRNA interferase YafQ
MTMLEIVYTNKMKRDVKLLKKRGKDISKLITALELLASRKPMPAKYCDHQLSGSLNDFRECHIEGDWLLLYQIFKDELILSASGTGTHSDIFGE